MEYIEREAALAQTHEINIAEVGYRHRCIDPQAIREIPAADVAPVRRGKWTEEPLGFYCSECGHPIDFHEKTTYCPMCGAKME